MNEICNEKHKQIDEKFTAIHKRLDEHEDDIGILKNDSATFKIEIKNLCQQVSELVKTLKWFMGLIVAGIITYFFNQILPKIIK